MKILRDPQNDMDYFVITGDGGRNFMYYREYAVNIEKKREPFGFQ